MGKIKIIFIKTSKECHEYHEKGAGFSLKFNCNTWLMALGDSGYQSQKCNVFPNSICHSVYIIFHLSKRFDYACINSCRSDVWLFRFYRYIYP